MSNEWQVPPAAGQPAGGPPRGRYVWGVAGGAVGLVANLAIVALLLVPSMFDEDQTTIEYDGLAVILLSVVASVLLLITGGLLCIGRRPRPFGVGLLIGAAFGLICANGVCVALVALAS